MQTELKDIRDQLLKRREAIQRELHQVDTAIRALEGQGECAAPTKQVCREEYLSEILKNFPDGLQINQVLTQMRVHGYLFKTSTPQNNWLYQPRAKKWLRIENGYVYRREGAETGKEIPSAPSSANEEA